MKTPRSAFLLSVILLYSNYIAAQDEKKSIKLDLSYSQINDQPPELRATAKSKNGKKFEPVEGLEVNFFLTEQAQGNLLGKARTNRKGIASLEIPASISSKLDSMSPFKLVASVVESKTFNEKTAEIEITKARINLSLTEADSVRKLEAKLLALKEGKWVEVPETEVKLFVRRMLSDLPIGDHELTTNETGDVSSDFIFKTAVPGDEKGNIIIGAKVEDNETYGTVMAMKFANWGVPQKADRSFYERSLWASRDKTPVWLLVVPNLIIVTVWAIIFYLIYFIFRIRKIGLQN
ncbi:hypothetical protein WSM22_20250 [Cytophagales bacterium WSM2-2]|nr:hypothetical protein WSM22_20250 [Cytophagales bacterium WSM2-2]